MNLTKAVLISIRPQHTSNILNGKKTIELRKVLPKWVKEEVAKGNSVDFYVYVTKAKPLLYYYDCIKNNSDWVWERVFSDTKPFFGDSLELFPINGTVPCKFTVRKIKRLERTDYYRTISDTGENTYLRMVTRLRENYEYDECIGSCLTTNELKTYGKGEDLYALHIEDLEIFDEPKKLSDFYKEEYAVMPNGVWPSFMPITKAPQSMQTVWVEKKV